MVILGVMMVADKQTSDTLKWCFITLSAFSFSDACKIWWDNETNVKMDNTYGVMVLVKLSLKTEAGGDGTQRPLKYLIVFYASGQQGEISQQWLDGMWRNEH